jgi:hypothetical protein
MVIAIDDRLTADAAFVGNALLATLSPEARALIEPHGTMVQLEAGDTILNRGDNVDASLFPLGETMVSMAIELTGDRMIEALLIGRRGAVGGTATAGGCAGRWRRARCRSR